MDLEPRDGGGRGISPSSLAPGVGGRAPGIGGAVNDGSCLLAVVGREGALFRNSVARGLVGDVSAFSGRVCVNVSPKGARCLGLFAPPLDFPEGLLAASLAFNRSSVARRRASRASSSDVWVDTAFFFCSTATSRSTRLLSILKTSFKAKENERAIVDCGRPVGFHSRSISPSDILNLPEVCKAAEKGR